MANNGGNGTGDHAGDGGVGPGPHDKFLELAALSTAGDLSPEEYKELRDHLAVCSPCRQAAKEFETVVDVGVPSLASELGQASSNPTSHVATRGAEPRSQELDHVHANIPISQRRLSPRTPLNWNFVWLPLAAAILLTVALGIYAYRVGKGRGVEIAQANLPRSDSAAQSKLEALEQQVSDAGHERETLKTQLVERDRTISDLRGQLQAQTSALSQLKAAQADLEASVKNADSDKQQLIGEQQKALKQKLDAAEISLQTAQAELESVRQDRSRDQVRAASLESQIKDLFGQLREREQAINKDEELLAHDRDIRDLMGARDLYIAEVYDVDRDGATQKPYGRVFYTRGKSLVFYAYDLDRQNGAKGATFQAWGRRGPDSQQALNLGIFYKDDLAKKRWALKFDDAKSLEQVDAVFVTVEPNGESHKPTGKSLLFAYLKVNPNHP